MKNLFVPLTIAIKLKELGFNEPCICGYDPDGKLRSKLTHSSNDGSKIDWDQYDSHTPAPLWGQVTAWLRNTKKINIFVGFRPNVKKWDAFFYDMNLNGKEYVRSQTMDKYMSREIFDTYEEALESAIISYINES